MLNPSTLKKTTAFYVSKNIVLDTLNRDKTGFAVYFQKYLHITGNF